MIVYRNSKDSHLIGKLYFDAPHWGQTATSDDLGFTVKSYPFDLRQAGVYDELIQKFHTHNTDISSADISDLAVFIENYVNENGVNPDPNSCMVIEGDRIAQVEICKDKYFAESYKLYFIFEKYSKALTEATQDGSSEKTPIGEYLENTMIYLPYPEVDNKTKEVEPPSYSRYAMILPSDIKIKTKPVIANDSVLIIKSTSQSDWLTQVAVTKDDLKNTPGRNDKELFDKKSYLIPSSLCYVDKRYRVQSRGRVWKQGQISDIRNAVLKYGENSKEGREITVMQANGNVDPQLYTEIKDDDITGQVSESDGYDSSVGVNTKNKVLIVLFE